MKLCKDCKHCENDNGIEYLKCNAPKNVHVNLATGGKDRKWKHCETHRGAYFISDLIGGLCGKRARWFEPKEQE